MIKMIISVTGDMEKNLSEIEEIQVKVLRTQKIGDITPKQDAIEQRVLLPKIEVGTVCEALKRRCKDNIYFRFSEENMTIFIKKPFKRSDLPLSGQSPSKILYQLLYETVCMCENCIRRTLNMSKCEVTCLLVNWEKRTQQMEGQNMW